MNTVVDIAEIVGGFGILVAILYAIWQVNEARKGREATFLASAFSQSPTEITIEMELVRRGSKEGMLTYQKFVELSDERQQRLMSPLNMFDLMGWMVSMGAIRLDSVTNFLGADVITRSWDAYQPFVEDMRKNMGDYLFIFFEDLARQSRQLEQTPRGRFRSKVG
jgi:hypothetical protein